MGDSATGVYRGVSAQKRRADRREQLMAAGYDLIGGEGWSATSVRAVCQRARLTPRFFYESFDDLDALAVAIFDEVIATTTERVLEAIVGAPDDPRARVRAALETLVHELTEDPRRGRIALIEALGNERMARRRLEAMRAVAGVIAAQGSAQYGADVDDPLVELTSLVLAGGLTELLIVWLDGGLRMSREQLVEDCAELFTATGQSAAALAERRVGLRR